MQITVSESDGVESPKRLHVLTKSCDGFLLRQAISQSKRRRVCEICEGKMAAWRKGTRLLLVHVGTEHFVGNTFSERITP